jgi:hypothetical protein
VPLPALSLAELLCCVRACAALRLPPRMGWYFREFLAQRVEPSWPGLAHKVRSMDEPELAALYAHVRCGQDGQRE